MLAGSIHEMVTFSGIDIEVTYTDRKRTLLESMEMSFTYSEAAQIPGYCSTVLSWIRPKPISFPGQFNPPPYRYTYR